MKLLRFLIDANLPYRFAIWHGKNFTHVFDLGEEWTDAQIWSYAVENDLVIVSKDSDFSYRILQSQPPPRVIHIRIGNMGIREFHQFIDQNWDVICQVVKAHKLVNVYVDRIEGII